MSKFSKTNLFSGLTNLNDITLDVATVFGAELAGLDREEIRHSYNGYNWPGEAVYNPFDLLLLFAKGKFNAYWFQGNAPAFLIRTQMVNSRAW